MGVFAIAYRPSPLTGEGCDDLAALPPSQSWERVQGFQGISATLHLIPPLQVQLGSTLPSLPILPRMGGGFS